ncbi:GntR family transcriptional regulator [Aliamphritea hakodatensis]|uniref:GntR family transcriptional regulator n=1 Tax=Aliamphritea hakodatensis TaxID=2895352 RepID=UPI0022FDA16C|nr:GntR family transcriptional regulator [Aliamphritea hakodatensis]
MRTTPNLVQTLEHEIVTGQLKPRDKLDETQLAERFGVSRTPVREALLQLRATGLIDMQPRKGAAVASIDLKNLLEMFEMMANYESITAKLAARRAGSADIEQIRQAHLAGISAAESGDVDTYFLGNIRFHESIYNASHNSFLARLATDLNKRLCPYRRTQLHCTNRITESHQEHQNLLSAIEHRNAELAASLAYDHIAVQGSNFTDFIARLNT